MSASPSIPIPAGALIAGRYRISREIGRGGMAQVYEGEHLDIGKRVAMKVLASEFATSVVVVERFLREARAAAAVRSPYICDVFDTGKLEDGRPFLVMELLEGESLYERMVRVRQFDVATTLRMTTHVCRGLTKAHAANIVHRDLKPENIFLTSDEEGNVLAKLLDFGLAKFYAPVDSTGAQARLTREGAIFGTPAYMSPEQVKGQGSVDHRADLWALGCIVYECFTGRTVWSMEQGVAMTFAQIASSPLPKLLRYRPDLLPSLETWFMRALERDVNRRFQTARELADAFADALNQSGPPSVITQLDAPYLLTPSPQNVASMSPFDVGVSPSASYPSNVGASSSTAGFRPGGFEQNNAAAALRAFAPSLVETGTSSSVKKPATVSSLPPPPRRSSRGWVLFFFTTLLAGGGFALWHFGLLALPGQGVALPPARPSVSAMAVPSASAMESASPSNLPRWVGLVRNAQAQLGRGETDAATKTLREAVDAGGGGQARALLENVTAASGNKGPCRPVGLGRVRPFTLASGFPGPPALVRLGRMLFAFWTDDHEAPGHSHAYVQQLDGVLRPVGNAVDVTPETEHVAHFAVSAVGERIVLVYGDTRGANAGLFMRWLDPDGRIGGPPISIGAARAAASSPSLAIGDSGVLWLVWEETRDADSLDLTLRKFDPKGPNAPEARLTNFIGRTRLASPSMGYFAGNLHILFRMDRDTTRTVRYLHIADGNQITVGGLGAIKDRVDRTIGNLHPLAPLTDKSEAPDLACDLDGCFGVWNVDRGEGVYAAFLDGRTGQMIWRKKFAPTGSHPAIAANQRGVAQVVWYDQGRMRTASVGREGVSPVSIIAHVAGEQPRASLVADADGKEWSIAWLDAEGGRPEPYALRLSCP